MQNDLRKKKKKNKSLPPPLTARTKTKRFCARDKPSLSWIIVGFVIGRYLSRKIKTSAAPDKYQTLYNNPSTSRRRRKNYSPHNISIN
jgi:hypothetical protein